MAINPKYISQEARDAFNKAAEQLRKEGYRSPVQGETGYGFLGGGLVLVNDEGKAKFIDSLSGQVQDFGKPKI